MCAVFLEVLHTRPGSGSPYHLGKGGVAQTPGGRDSRGVWLPMLMLGCSGPGLDARTPARYTSKPPLLNPLSPLPLVPPFQKAPPQPPNQGLPGFRLICTTLFAGYASPLTLRTSS